VPLSTTNPTCTGLGLNQASRVRRQLLTAEILFLAVEGRRTEAATNAGNSTILDKNFVLLITVPQHKHIFIKTIKQNEHNAI
jgi:hypothetical protein